MIRTGTYRYVPWPLVNDYALMGWIVGDIASEYSCFMWSCCCNPDGHAPRWGIR